MVALKNHDIIAKIEYLTHKTAITAKGKVLRNTGAGWKMHGKLKDNLSPMQHAQELQAEQAERLATRPAYANLLKVLHSYVPQKYRSQVYHALQALGDDVDGLFSEINDHMGYEMNNSMAVDDCLELSRAYMAAVRELQYFKQSQAS